MLAQLWQRPEHNLQQMGVAKHCPFVFKWLPDAPIRILFHPNEHPLEYYTSCILIDVYWDAIECRRGALVSSTFFAQYYGEKIILDI